MNIDKHYEMLESASMAGLCGIADCLSHLGLLGDCQINTFQDKGEDDYRYMRRLRSEVAFSMAHVEQKHCVSFSLDAAGRGLVVSGVRI